MDRSSPLPPEPETGQTLIFHWPKPLEQGRRLIFWIFVVILGLAAFFYVFQVVYPQSQRRTPVPHQVILLDPANPAARAILHKVQDRDFLVLPGEEAIPSRLRLEDTAPVFHPSYEDHRLELQELPHKQFTVPPARLLKVDEPMLPPLDLSELKPGNKPPAGSSPAVQPRLHLKLDDGLVRRKVVHPPDFSGLEPANPGGHKVQLAVDANGQVWFALPLRETENLEISRQLAARLLLMRFEPLDSAGAESGAKTSTDPHWGTATFEWRTTP